MRLRTPQKKPAVPKWTLTILGCGTSTGVPLLFCECKICRSKNPKNHRLRSSAWLQVGGKSLLIDTSTDLRQQALRERIPRLDAVLYTHPHSDHVSGIDEIRSFNYIQKSTIPAYGNAWTVRDLRARFPYLFATPEKAQGGGVALIDLHEFESSASSIDVAGVSVMPISLNHGREECIGYRFDDLAYITDCSAIPSASMERLRRLDTLVLDCLRIAPHSTHFHLERSLETVRELHPRRAVFTHLGHDFDYATWTKKLPKGIALAYDGMRIRGERS